MKVTSFLCVFVFHAVALSAQTTEEIFKLDWKVGGEVVIYGNAIVRVAGENKNGVTNVAYINHHQVYENSEELYVKRASIGGEIELYVARKVRTRDNVSHFTIVISDKQEKELFRKKLIGLVSYRVEGDPQWYIREKVMIPITLEKPFLISVVDSLATENRTFKFEVINKVPKIGDQVFVNDYMDFTRVYCLYDTIGLRELKSMKLDEATFEKLKNRKALLSQQLRETYTIETSQFAERKEKLIGKVKDIIQYYGTTFIEIELAANVELTPGDSWQGLELEDKNLYKVVPNRKFIESSDIRGF